VFNLETSVADSNLLFLDPDLDPISWVITDPDPTKHFISDSDPFFYVIKLLTLEMVSHLLHFSSKMPDPQ